MVSKKEVRIRKLSNICQHIRIIISFLLLFLCCPSHAITWEDRGGEAIRLGVVTATTTTPSGTYYSVTGNGVIAESRDGGMTWAPQIIGVTIQKMLNMLKMEFVMGKLDGVAKYTDGEWVLLKNPDGGYDWVQYVLRTSGNLTHIVANDRQTAYAMTDRKIWSSFIYL